jgi:flagellar hook-associated protein 1 FlgK
MSLSSAASIARSGLNAIAAETSVTSRNITGNSDTTIYSRKIANVVATLNGSQVISITRASNRVVFENFLSSTSGSSMRDALSAGLDSLDQTIGDVASSTPEMASSAHSPAAFLSKFTNALQSYEASPSDMNFAANAVAAAKSLASGLNSASAVVQETRARADSDIAASVAAINSLLSEFQVVNTQIVHGTATSADITDAQDQRDEILARLAEEIGIATTVGPNNDMSIYTDSGVTLFQGGLARTAAFASTNVYTASTIGNVVYVDGVPIAGQSAPMPITSGRLAGLAILRDSVSVTYQIQLDNMAGALISLFAESDQIGGGPDLPGLFTTPGAGSMPTGVTGLAGQIVVNASVDPSQGGNASLLRDGGIADPGGVNYTYNATGAASDPTRLSQLLANLSMTQSYGPAGDIAIVSSLSRYASASVGWLEAERARNSSESAYQSALLNTATTALSNAAGVNLDDEMSKLLDLEQSYSASAKLITTIDAMFHVLLTDIGSA